MNHFHVPLLNSLSFVGSEIDEILKPGCLSTTASQQEDTVHLSQSVNDSDSLVMTSQEVLSGPSYYESPIDEYFTSKNKHNDSSVFLGREYVQIRN